AAAGQWLALAGAAIAGHIFPVWLKFRGGKGVATGLGAVLGLWPVLTLPGLAAAVVWLRDNTAREAVVLAAYQTGNYVAARAGNRVVLGHWAETMDFVQKQQAVERFFRIDTSDEWRQALLREYGVDYVWHGPPEGWIGDFEPGAADYLQPVHRVGEVVVYRVE
ncbi:MAG: glycerol-3-phosphate acyltransferase, partial [Chloroflexota bacterium]